MKYTVLLQYPEYLTDGELQTYTAHVHAEDPDEAVGVAKDHIRSEDIVQYHADTAFFKVLFVIAGHHDNLTPERAND